MSGVVFSVNGNPRTLQSMIPARISLVLAIVLSYLFGNIAAHGASKPLFPTNMMVCKALDGELAAPNAKEMKRESRSCRAIDRFWQIDPQGTHVWVISDIQISSETLESDQPLGFYISAKASSEVFWNGELLGQNGVPSSTQEAELPGKMDVVFYLPKTKLKLGNNQVAMRMSSHNGLITLRSPVHFIGVGEYAKPTDQALRNYWVTLVPLGVLILGGLYIGMLAITRRRYWPDMVLPAMSLVAVVQLVAEVYRGIAAYAYWVQDLRLIVILLCSILFGLGLISYTVGSLASKKHRKYQMFAVAGVAFVLILALVAIPGFDLKSAFSLLFPACVALIVSLVYLFRRDLGHDGAQLIARRFCLIYTVFLLVLLFTAKDFLNVTFYYVIAGLMVLLFVNEADRYVQEQKARFDEQARADKLQSILDQLEQSDASDFISVTRAGNVEQVPICDIVYCKGAGDYVELVLTGGASLLHSERLTDLEKTLPSMFLRVHRSYIVNTMAIRSLERKSSGVGELKLNNDHVVPVSRRVMPSVRQKLS